tara:strand:- start:515 stop:712 length:198 start_codon:yes stop_codon:yes gene_type:complete
MSNNKNINKNLEIMNGAVTVTITKEELNHLKALEYYANEIAKGINTQIALKKLKSISLKMNKRIL